MLRQCLKLIYTSFEKNRTVYLPFEKRARAIYIPYTRYVILVHSTRFPLASRRNKTLYFIKINDSPDLKPSTHPHFFRAHTKRDPGAQLYDSLYASRYILYKARYRSRGFDSRPDDDTYKPSTPMYRFSSLYIHAHLSISI